MSYRLRHLVAAFGGAAIALGVSNGAWAQAATQAAVESSFHRDRNVSVRERPRPAYDALGLRTGAFLVFPRIEGSLAYEDNIFASEINETDDVVYSLLPSVTAASQWSRHSLQAQLQANLFQYADNKAQNNSTFHAATNGRLDVLRGTQITGGVAFDHLVEPRTSSSTPQNTLDPVEYDQYGADFGVSREVNRFRLRGDLHYRTYQFSDTRTFAGVPVDQDFRDNDFWEGAVRVDYAMSPALAFYGTAIASSWDFARPTAPADVNRDASGYQVAAGADFELSNLVRGQLQAGLLTTKFDDPRIKDFTGLGLLARVEYFPTQLLTLEFNARRTVEATAVIGAAGVVHTVAGVQADYELFRNLILTARASYGRDIFRGAARKDKIIEATLGANYLINRRLGLNLLYRRYEQDSSGIARGLDFVVNRIQAGLVVQF